MTQIPRLVLESIIMLLVHNTMLFFGILLLRILMITSLFHILPFSCQPEIQYTWFFLLGPAQAVAGCGSTPLNCSAI